MNTLIVVIPVDTGYYLEVRGVRDGLRALHPTTLTDVEELEHGTVLRNTKIFSCMKGDVPAAVEEISKHNVGVEIKVYSLVSQYTRLPGELKTITITKDGKLPF